MLTFTTIHLTYDILWRHDTDMEKEAFAQQWPMPGSGILGTG